jgi:uncharacterized RDD family membrane protein YckC
VTGTVTPRPGGVRGRRLVARAIDEAVVLALQAGFLLVAAVLGGLSHLSGDDDRAEVVAVAVGIAAAGWLAGVTYEVVGTRCGGPMGKRWLRLRVHDAAHRRLPSWRQAFLRWALVAGVQPVVWLALGLGGEESSLARLALVVGITASLAWRVGLAISVLRSPGATGLHDHLIGTRVARTFP